MVPWQDHWSEEAWREYLTVGEKESELAAIRRCTYTGRPLGTASARNNCYSRICMLGDAKFSRCRTHSLAQAALVRRRVG